MANTEMSGTDTHAATKMAMQVEMVMEPAMLDAFARLKYLLKLGGNRTIPGQQTLPPGRQSAPATGPEHLPRMVCPSLLRNGVLGPPSISHPSTHCPSGAPFCEWEGEAGLTALRYRSTTSHVVVNSFARSSELDSDTSP